MDSIIVTRHIFFNVVVLFKDLNFDELANQLM